MGEEEGEKREGEKGDKGKGRKKNGGKGEMDYEMEEEEDEVYGEDGDFEMNKGGVVRRGGRICVGYECVGMGLMKEV